MRLPILLGLFCTITVVGCSEPDGYPTDLTYPLRDNPLVLRAPTIETTESNEPGSLDSAIAKLPEIGGELFDPTVLPASHRTSIVAELEALFGRPATPLVPLPELGLDPNHLQEGSRLYKRLCLHCHGLTGDGRGPTGAWVQPHPRDFRLGTFKYVSTSGDSAHKPRRDDLRRLIRDGLPGSSMPSFKLLNEEQIERLVDYVIHLSMRGETETETLREAELLEVAEIPTVVGEFATLLGQRWLGAESSAMEPAAQPPERLGESRFTKEHFASVRRGYESFVNTDGAGCIKCHVDFGRQAKYRYDIWGAQVKPRNLTEGIHRGGSRPIDIYWRIRGGIGPSGMPSFDALTEDQLWDLVHFVRALPEPYQLPPDVRSKIYPGESE